MKIQTILGKVRYQQDCIFLFSNVITNINFQTVKMTVQATGGPSSSIYATQH